MLGTRKYNSPYAFTDAALAKMRVWIINAREHRLQCQACGGRWCPVLGYCGRLPDRYWICPNGCNADGMTGDAHCAEAEESLEQCHTDNGQQPDVHADTPGK